MRAFQKKVFIAFLSFSNLGVLGAVFYAYFDSHQNLLMFSSSGDSMADLREKIKKECRQYLDALLKGERSSFTCRVKTKQRQNRASYTLKTEFKVTKKKGEDNKFVFQKTGTIQEPTKGATEADFCNDCSFTEEREGHDLEELMRQLVDMAEDDYHEAKEKVREAQEEYNKKEREKRLANIKERNCEGRWDKDSESFEEFDREERLECSMKRVSEMNLPLDVENYYHKKLKKELWATAFSDESYLLEDGLLDKFEDPYRYSFSVRASTGLLKNYLGWKDDFELLDSFREKQNFLRGIKPNIDQMLGFINKEQAEQDWYYLNKGFDGALAQLKKATGSLRPWDIPATTQPINYEDVRRETESLY